MLLASSAIALPVGLTGRRLRVELAAETTNYSYDGSSYAEPCAQPICPTPSHFCGLEDNATAYHRKHESIASSSVGRPMGTSVFSPARGPFVDSYDAESPPSPPYYKKRSQGIRSGANAD